MKIRYIKEASMYIAVARTEHLAFLLVLVG